MELLLARAKEEALQSSFRLCSQRFVSRALASALTHSDAATDEAQMKVRTSFGTKS